MTSNAHADEKQQIDTYNQHQHDTFFIIVFLLCRKTWHSKNIYLFYFLLQAWMFSFVAFHHFYNILL